MRQIAFYLPQLDMITFMTVLDGGRIGFEWGFEQACEWSHLFTDPEHDITNYLMICLGEL